MENIQPQALAFLGDGVMKLFIREKLIGTAKIDALHRECARLECAKTQSKRFEEIKDRLTDEEQQIANRARNANYGTKPASCSLQEYRMASALEAVIGYNYLLGNIDRCREVIFDN